MKKQFHKILIIAVVALITFGSCTTQRTPYSQQGYVDFQLFYDHLSPYGNWVDYPGYGYVWIPEAGYGFEPYATNGHWIMTEFGWTWVSNYRWGWAPFHYGRWDLDNRLGWFWVPDNVWGPAWVSWRRGGGYYGWAPLRPGMNSGYGGQWDVNHWHFVRDRDFGRTDIHRHYINRGNYGEIIRNSSVINNTHVDRRRNATYISGPDRDEVQRVTGRRFNSLSVSDSNRPGSEISKEQLRIYRPQIQGSASTRTQRPVPSKVYSRDEVKPSIGGRSSRMPDNTYTPNERRDDKLQQMERRRQEQNQINEQRQQKLEQRRQQIEQRQQNNTRQSRPLNQPKREEKSQQIEQQQNQTAPQTPSNENNTRPFGGRRK